jgi:hypothetical protein
MKTSALSLSLPRNGLSTALSAPFRDDFRTRVVPQEARHG